MHGVEGALLVDLAVATAALRAVGAKPEGTVELSAGVQEQHAGQYDLFRDVRRIVRPSTGHPMRLKRVPFTLALVALCALVAIAFGVAAAVHAPASTSAAASSVPGHLFTRHRALFGIIGIGGKEGIPPREPVVGVVGLGVAHAEIVAPSGLNYPVTPNVHGAFVYATPANTKSEDQPRKLVLRDSNNRLVGEVVAGER
jgi:hypothetical protein